MYRMLPSWKIVVFSNHVDKDLDYFLLNKRHVSSQGGANKSGG